jgi:diguanylate cyclase (GGDEF)-like protein
MNAKARELAGRGRSNFVVGSSLWEVFPEEIGGIFDQQYQLALQTQKPVVFEGYLRLAEAWLEVHAFPEPELLNVFFRDITARRRIHDHIQYLAHHDDLTALPNRVLFREQLNKAITSRGSSEVAILHIDIDQFKEVNDTFGHSVGDAFLVEIANRLRRCVRESDTVARLGGDEFAVIQRDLNSRDHASTLALQIIDTLDQTFDVNGKPIKTRASIGVAICPGDGEDPTTLFKNADIALYAVKSSGGGAYRFFDSAMEERGLARQALKRDLGNALANSQFHLVFQPIVDLQSNRVSSLETLLRWRHPDRGLVPPDEFIAVAEETGLIIPIGDWVLENACAEALKWSAKILVAVNFSPRQFQDPELYTRIAGILARTGLPPRRLELEVTESVLLQDSEANLNTLRKLRTLGVQTALDDFGTGYSSLSYLQKFPFDKIKIDQSFIGDLQDSQSSKAIVQAITDLGHALGMSVTVEGIETRQQLDGVRAKGCDSAQGYFLSKPVRGHEVQGLLERLETGHIWWGKPASRHA